MDDYIDILRDWERNVADPAIFSHIDELFPVYGFRRSRTGDRWLSPLKLDLSEPKVPNKEKTVVSSMDFRFHEQGEWDNSVGVIDMLMETYNLGSVYDAYTFAAGRLGLDMPKSAGKGSAKYRERSRTRKLLDTLEDYFHWNLMNNSGFMCRAVKDYLKVRGFTEQDMVDLRFGFVPSWEKVEAYVTDPKRGFTREEMDEACRVRSDEGKTTVGWKHVLAIPYRCGGETKGFLFRTVEKDVQPKYKASTGLDRKSCFFNMPADSIPKDIIVVEGEMDALTATAAGIANVVAIGGSDISGERRKQVIDALNRNTQRITLCLDLDADKEGQPNSAKRIAATRRSLHTIFDVSPDKRDVRVAVFPEVGDPDEFIRRHGADAFRLLIARAVPWQVYLYRNLTD